MRMAAVAKKEGRIDLRSRRRHQTGRDIERAALGLFERRGFDAVTVEEIAAASGVSRRRFFRYFASKDELLIGERRRLMERLAHDLAECRPGEVRSRKVIADTPEVFARAFAGHHSVKQDLVRIVARRAGVDPAEDLRPAVLVATTFAALQVAMSRWASAAGQEDLGDLVRAALSEVCCPWAEGAPPVGDPGSHPGCSS